MSGATHGLASTYRNPDYGCRCEPCTAANTERVRQERQRRAERLAADPSLAPHGSSATYGNWGCRCESCAAAHAQVMAAQWDQRKKDGTMTLPADFYLERGAS